MTYVNWKLAIGARASSAPEVEAQVYNLCEEWRIANELRTFRRKIGQHFKSLCKDGTTSELAAESALKEAITWTKVADSEWLGKLPFPYSASLPATTAYTHMTAVDAARYVTDASFDPKQPRPRVRLRRPYKTGPGGRIIKRFIWATFDHGDVKPADDPATIAREYGLAHYEPEDYVYRMSVTLRIRSLYIPTCLDAELYEAWAPPPKTHGDPWGLTRNLSTGEFEKPELLTETRAHVGDRQIADLVGAGPPPTSVGSIPRDFMAKRS